MEPENLKNGVYCSRPLVILQRELENGELERGSLLVGEGKVVDILVVLRIFGSVITIAEEYDQTRAVLEFEIVDSEQKYSKYSASLKGRIIRLRLESWRLRGFPSKSDSLVSNRNNHPTKASSDFSSVDFASRGFSINAFS